MHCAIKAEFALWQPQEAIRLNLWPERRVYSAFVACGASVHGCRIERTVRSNDEDKDLRADRGPGDDLCICDRWAPRGEMDKRDLMMAASLALGS